MPRTTWFSAGLAGLPGASVDRTLGPWYTHIEFPMPISAFAGLVFGVAVLTIGLYHVTFVAPRFRSITATLQGGGDEGESPSAALVRAALAAFENKTEGRLTGLETVVKRDLHRIGFVRYNSFEDVGSDLSFTLALLNDEGDGVVVTSIYSREETRTYGKAVKKYVPQQGASKEEQSAIAIARNGGSA